MRSKGFFNLSVGLSLMGLVLGCAGAGKRLEREPSSTPSTLQFVPSLGPAKGGTDRIYETAVLKVLQSATRSIDIIQFNFDSSNGFTATLAKTLMDLQKKNSKLKIRVLLEKEGFGAAAKNAATQRLLGAAGIEVHLLTGRPDPHGGPSGIVHTKMVNVDSGLILAGSTNWTNTSIEKNNEANLLIQSQGFGRELTAYADALIQDPKGMHRKVLQEGTVTLFTDTAYFDALLAFFGRGKAGDRLDCSMYLFNVADNNGGRTGGVLGALTEASKRGVKVRILLEQSGYDHFINQQSTGAAKLLKAADIEVYLDSPSKITHSKFCILTTGRDRAFLLGSTNWNYLDIDLNHQLNWQVERAGRSGDALAAFFDLMIDAEGVAQ